MQNTNCPSARSMDACDNFAVAISGFSHFCIATAAWNIPSLPAYAFDTAIEIRL
ncbi:hypothetical protein AM571_CH02369 [Rhizobium etli 8C-3]|uniref:Uncharacterized protein n=1 Tax=Rhizobium etli 8C-3 TaxID=538025 RepID=A0A1L5P4V6_RHIET|nr:hypothetical protein AM571_CH02369 [Rhizobium etli 8C-3]